jgi:hypothetical protein
MSNHTHVQRIGLRRSTVAAAIVAAAIGLSAATQVAVGNAGTPSSAVIAMPGGGCGGGC